jgi:hypothetical protein
MDRRGSGTPAYTIPFPRQFVYPVRRAKLPRHKEEDDVTKIGFRRIVLGCSRRVLSFPKPCGSFRG